MCITDIGVKYHHDRRIGSLEMKYTILIIKLKFAFMEKKHSVPDIISSLCDADKGKFTCFHSEPYLHSAKSIHEIFYFIEKESRYFSYTILERVVKKSGCKKSKELMKNYIQEIENSYVNVQTDNIEYQNNANTFVIVYGKDKLLVKELNNIIRALEKCLSLPKASILVRSVTSKRIICKVSLQVKERVSKFQHELKDLSNLRIVSLIIDDIKIPSDDDNKVNIVKHVILYSYIII